ncbi:hypothetical protein BAUCODRAFT_36654 [Baudoinia panamericana UAMH 10762]|uniref:Uncharacterized protein n=1 Tax=Baudoinia panamericana (strain UAMH 10762) TaxID=717646 RepID=M2N5X7_BAUPA|nr:uncharacterized protein BAUCODRAFT_36654 [Baudoinia panamericana UAMH 10762]EMC94180.1 hypothetical protein BAUCODRAFT_36654 [Baudoinia panamericana UAMH 10762]
MFGAYTWLCSLCSCSTEVFAGIAEVAAIQVHDENDVLAVVRDGCRLKIKLDRTLVYRSHCG